MSNSNGLKPCPFCGGKARMQQEGSYHNYFKIDYSVECIDCGASTLPSMTKKEAKKDWNRRI